MRDLECASKVIEALLKALWVPEPAYSLVNRLSVEERCRRRLVLVSDSFLSLQKFALAALAPLSIVVRNGELHAPYVEVGGRRASRDNAAKLALWDGLLATLTTSAPSCVLHMEEPRRRVLVESPVRAGLARIPWCSLLVLSWHTLNLSDDVPDVRCFS